MLRWLDSLYTQMTYLFIVEILNQSHLKSGGCLAGSTVKFFDHPQFKLSSIRYKFYKVILGIVFEVERN